MFDVTSFVIIRLQSLEEKLSSAIVLDISAELCGLRVDYEECDEDLWFKCSIKLAGKQVGESICSDKFGARDAAAERVLRYLLQVCPTIIVKDMSNCRDIESVITPAQVCYYSKYGVGLWYTQKVCMLHSYTYALNTNS